MTRTTMRLFQGCAAAALIVTLPIDAGAESSALGVRSGADTPISTVARTASARSTVGPEIVRHFSNLKRLLEDGAAALANEPLALDPDLLAQVRDHTQTLAATQVTPPDIGEPWLAAALDPEVQAMSPDTRGAEIARRAEDIYQRFETEVDALRATRDQLRTMANEARARFDMARRVTAEIGKRLSTQLGAMADVATGRQLSTAYSDLLLHGVPAIGDRASAAEALAARLDRAVAQGEADLQRHAVARALGRWAALEPFARSAYNAQREAFIIADHLDPPTMAAAQTRIARETIEQGNADTAVAARKLFEVARRKSERMADHRLILGVLQLAGGLTALGQAAAGSGMTADDAAPTLPEVRVDVKVNGSGAPGATSPQMPEVNVEIVIP